MQSLKAILFFSLSSALALLTYGCLEMNQEIIIHQDGSANIYLRYSVPLSQLQLMGEFQDMIQEQQTGQPPASEEERNWMFNEELAREYFNQEGMSLNQFRMQSDEENQRHYAEIEFTVDNLNNTLESGRMGNFELEKKDDEEKTVFRANFPTTPNEEDATAEITAEDAEILSELLRGLKIELTVETPAPIIETTGEKIDAQTVHWQFEPAAENDWFQKPPRIEVAY